MMRGSTTSTLLCSSLTYLIVEPELWIEFNLFTKLTNINKNFSAPSFSYYKQLGSFIALQITKQNKNHQKPLTFHHASLFKKLQKL